MTVLFFCSLPESLLLYHSPSMAYLMNGYVGSVQVSVTDLNLQAADLIGENAVPVSNPQVAALVTGAAILARQTVSWLTDHLLPECVG